MTLISLWILLSSFFIYFQTYGIYAGDAGDLVTAAYTHGVAHPPGFPLYTLLGFLISKIPIATVAWKVTLLSSLAASSTLTILFALLRKITKSALAAFIAITSLGLTYVFWLYAIVPEVFMLNILFTIALIFLLYTWHESKKDVYFYFFWLVLGLSLAHHPIILFLIPSFMYWIYGVNNQLIRKKSMMFYTKCLLLFLAGLLPYLYIPIAANTNPFINWNNATTLGNFMKLVTRADYGTFQSGPNIGQSYISRLLQLPLIGQFFLLDFRPLGVVLMFLGAINSFKHDRKLFIWLFLAFLCSGPLYFFYASYIFTDSFSIATLERFLLPSYAIATIWLALGCVFLTEIVLKLVKKLLTNRKLADEKMYRLIIFVILLLMPLSFFYINHDRLAVLRNDTTSERFAKDILITPEKNAILLLERDNTLFNVQYVYATEQFRPDIKLFHFYRLYIGELADYSKEYYPEVYMPEGRQQKLVDAFIEKNYERFPIYANTSIPLSLKNMYWVRTGLLLRLYKKDDLPEISQLLKKNDDLWRRYSDPLSQSLGSYKNLMLTNILDFYEEGHIQTGILFEGALNHETAINHYREALRLKPDSLPTYIRISRVHATKGSCLKAQETLIEGFDHGLASLDSYELMYEIQMSCFKDEKSALLWKKKIEDVKKGSEIQLKEL